MIKSSCISVTDYKGLWKEPGLSIVFDTENNGLVRVLDDPRLPIRLPGRTEILYHLLRKFRDLILGKSKSLCDPRGNPSISFSYSDREDIVTCYGTIFGEDGKLIAETVTKGGEMVIHRHIDGICPDLGVSGNLVMPSQDERISELHGNSETTGQPFLLTTLSDQTLYTDISSMIIQDLDPEVSVTTYPDYIQELVRQIIPRLGFAILTVTPDWRFITYHDPNGEIPLENHGSGIKRVMSILPRILITAMEGGIYCIPWLSSSMHPKLEIGLLSIFNEYRKPEKFGKILFSGAQEEDRYHQEVWSQLKI